MCCVTVKGFVSSSAESFERSVWPTMILGNFQPINTISKYHVHSLLHARQTRVSCVNHIYSHFVSLLFFFRNRNPAKIIFGFWCNRRRIDCWCAAQIHFGQCAICIKSTQPRMHWRRRNRDKQSARTIHSTIQRPFLSVSFPLRVLHFDLFDSASSLPSSTCKLSLSCNEICIRLTVKNELEEFK